MTDIDLKKSRRVLFIVAGCFMAPLAIAFVLYYGNLWRPAHGTQKGDLIYPARHLPSVTMTMADGGTKSSAEIFKDKWSLVYVGDGQCDTRCQTALADMRQARLLLTDKMDRVQRIFLTTDHCCSPELLREPQGLIVATFASGAFAMQFPSYGSIPVASAGRVYIVDPLGNLMMSYRADAPIGFVLEDLKQLLQLSQIG